MVATSVCAPEVSRTPAQVRSSAANLSPRSSATRWRSASAKSTSPFIERRVIAATCSPKPACTASSSKVSPVTMVLSMSATSSPLRRPRERTGSASTAAPANAVRTAAMSGAFGQGTSTASPAASTVGVPPPTAVAHSGNRARRERGDGAGSHQGEDMRHGPGAMAEAGGLGKACHHRCRADLQRQVGPGAASGPAFRRHRDQRRLHAGVSRAAHPHRPPHTGGGGAGPPRALRRALRSRAGQRGLVARRRPRRHGHRLRAHPMRRHRPLPARPHRRPGRHPRPRPSSPRGGPPPCWPSKAPTPCTPAWPPPTPPPPPRCARATASASPAPGKCGAAPAAGW